MAANHQNREWKVLCWNTRGLNAEDKCIAVKSKINESQCQIVCLHIDQDLLKKFCPQRIDAFEYLPSIGASGGTIIAWSSTLFKGRTYLSKPLCTISGIHKSSLWRFLGSDEY